MDTEFLERADGPTPHGGDYSIAHYLDAARNPSPKKDAYFVDIIEYAADGSAIHQFFITIERNAPKPSLLQRIRSALWI